MIDKYDPELLGLAIRECTSRYHWTVTDAADTVFSWLSRGWRLDTPIPPDLGVPASTSDLWPGESREIAADAGYNPTIRPSLESQGGTGG